MTRSFLFTALAAIAVGFASTFPVEAPDLSLSKLVKRWEAGPEMGGANFPDPCIIKVGKIWYSFATRTIGSSINIQIAQSWDYKTWAIVNDGYNQRDALPNVPAWVNMTVPNTWAPDVVRLDDGTFLMYYCATTNADVLQHCVGAAKSNSILGPYEPVGNAPLVCPTAQGGAIDPSGYDDGGQRYLVYKVDGNSQGNGGDCGNDVAPYVPTPIQLQPVGADGVTFTGSATTLIDNNGAADDGIVEAPSLVKHWNTYVLFFSSGCYTTGDYTVNYATANSINGPYTRTERPLFQTGDLGLEAPGGPDIYRDGRHLVFHANSGSGRALYEAVIKIEGNTVTA